MNDAIIPLYRFWQPQYWPLWLLLGIGRLIVMLPHPVRLACGRGFGHLLLRVLSHRRHIALRNLEICFPQKSPDERQHLCRAHFESLGMTLVEMGIAWWASDREIAGLVELRGTEYLLRALEGGHGALLLSGHFGATEVAGRIAQGQIPPGGALYRPSRNPLVDQVIRRCRQRTIDILISKDSVRDLLRTLRSNSPVWYAADQSYKRKGTVLVPFFDERCMTSTATSQLARLSGAPVLPILSLRLPNGHYLLEIFAPLEEFPGKNPEEDAIRTNKLLEEQILRAPEQYFWLHRRFKDRPKPLTDPYSRATPPGSAR